MIFLKILTDLFLKLIRHARSRRNNVGRFLYVFGVSFSQGKQAINRFFVSIQFRPDI
jgi:hypothetical protein